MISKGNRVGGTLLTMACARIWARGDYDACPFEWKGRRFEGPTRGLIIGYDNDQLRGATMKCLLGDGRPWGIGPDSEVWPLMSKELCEQSEIFLSRDNVGCVDQARIPHVDGGFSTIFFKTQSQDFGTIMGDSFDWVIYDEFVYKPLLYSQVRVRTFDKDGIIMIPGTPERRGGTPPDQEIIKRFTNNEDNETIYYRQVSLYEAEHFTKEQIEKQIKSLEPWEIPFRVYGRPSYGDVLVFSHFIENKKDYMIDPEEIPEFKDAKHICGLDWGMIDYGAIVWMMIDVYGNHYVWDYSKIRNLNINDISAYMRSRYRDIGFDVPVVCGRDVGARNPNRESQALSTREMLLEEGVNMFPKPAYNSFTKSKNNMVLPGLEYVGRLFRQKKLFISSSPKLHPLVDELESIYLKDGEVAKRTEMRFDGVEALRYACIMDRFAARHSEGKWRKDKPRYAESSARYRSFT